MPSDPCLLGRHKLVLSLGPRVMDILATINVSTFHFVHFDGSDLPPTSLSRHLLAPAVRLPRVLCRLCPNLLELVQRGGVDSLNPLQRFWFLDQSF